MKRYGMKIKSLVFSLLVIASGILLIAFNSGALPIEYKPVVFSLPMLLVAFGFINLFSRHSWFFGVIAILAGGFFLLPKLDIAGLGFIAQNGWPIALIVIGICILFKVLFHRNFGCHPHTPFHDDPENYGKFQRKIERRKEWHSRKWKSRKNESGYIDRNCIFSGCKEKMDIKDFKGGEINSVFGGAELDFSDAQLAEGIHHLEINSVFGGIILYVPIDWNIEIRQNQVFGQFVDNRPKPGFEINENSTLIIEASSIFGGGEIKCKKKSSDDTI